MKKRSSARGHISPINPSLHFILFLVLALVLVVFVAAMMQQTVLATRAKLVCPQQDANPVTIIESLSKRCGSNGVEMINDTNGCSTWVCKTPLLKK